MAMNDREKMIALAGPRNIILNSSARYGLARNVPASDEQGRDVRICLAVVERDNGSFEVIGINEERIRFHGPAIIEEEILRRVHA
jgi:hypothetical protein